MHYSNKAITTVVVTMILLISSVMALAYVALPVEAQVSATQPTTTIPAGANPPTIPDEAFLSFRPNPVGVGQSVLINAWISPSVATDRAAHGYTFTITKPDGTVADTITMNSEPDTGAAWFEYVFDTVGDWKIKFDFPGTYFPAGRYAPNGVIVTNTTGLLYTGDSWYPPDSYPEQTLHVQQNMIASWPPSPLPTDYWERPVRLQNREWLSITGDFPWYGPGGGTDWPEDTSTWFQTKNAFIPYVQAPNTGHIAWKRSYGIAGITGGGRYGLSGAGIASGFTEYSVPFRTTSASMTSLPCIIAGRGYQTNTKMVNGVPTAVFECYDIRTGENIWDAIYNWTLPSSTQSFGQWVWAGGIEYSGGNPTIIYVTSGQLLKINPSTGAISNFTLGFEGIPATVISPASYGTYYMNGYVLSIQPQGTPSNPSYRLLNWTTLGTSTNFASRIVSNISWPWSNLGSGGQDFGLGIAVNSGTGWVGSNGKLGGFDGPTNFGLVMEGVNMQTGVTVWSKNYTDLTTYSTVSCMVDHGLFAFLTDKGTYNAYSVLDGSLVWTSERMDYPWDASGFGAYDTSSAYGLFYREAYSGLYAFNWTNGKIVWKYEAPNNPFETPYTNEDGQTVNSFNGVDLIADGKLYSINTEHSPTQPITRGWGLHCMDARTGEPIWNITTGGGSAEACADGYLSITNSYDGYQYVFGKGKSATTVTAPDTVVPLGSGLVIKGTVLDESPAQPGTPCVSKDSMKTQMEYLHFQYPIDGLLHNEIITGVPVTLTAFGADGTFVDIGTTTTDGYGGTFGLAWAPTAEGTYTVTASFAGDDSYGSSMATTTVTVGPAPAPITFPEQEQPIDYTITIIVAAIGIVIAVVIALAVAVLMLRKR